MKKRKLWIVPVVVLLAAAAAGYGMYTRWYQEHKVELADAVYDRSITQLDLTGMELPDIQVLTRFDRLELLDARNLSLAPEQYDALCAALPDCTVLWTVPFQGMRLEEDTKELTVTALTAQDVELLRYFPKLEAVHASGCGDYALLEKLREDRPELNVDYTVRIGDADYAPDIEELHLEIGQLQQLKAVVLYLPELKNVYLAGEATEHEAVYELMQLRPEVTFHWEFSLFGVRTSSMATELILNDIPMESTEQVENALKYFYDLQRVEMCNCGIPSEEMDALWKRHPQTRFVWTVKIRDATVRTDVTGLIPIKLGYYMSNRLEDADCTELKYLVDLVCLDMGHMNITDYSFLQYMPKLKYLILIDTLGTDFSALVYCKELIYLEIFFTKFSQTELLLELPKLQDLNIGFTPKPDLEVLRQMTYLKRIWMPRTGLTDAEYKQLKKDMPDTQIVMYVEHSTAGNWRDNDNYRDMRDILGMEYMQ